MSYFDRFFTKTNEVERSQLSISDPALAEFFGLSNQSSAGVNVNETTSLGLTAVYRAVSLIAGTIASLPLKTYRTLSDDTRERTSSFMDNPCPGLTAFEWKELVMAHLLLHGNAYLFHVYNGAGALVGLQPIHPMSVSLRTEGGVKVFRISFADGTQREYTALDVTHIKALGTDGIKGMSPIQMTRNAIGTGLAGNEAAATFFQNGGLRGGLVTGELTQEQAEQAMASIRAKIANGNPNDLTFLPRDLTYSPFTMTLEDAQFIESRMFQVEEVSRIFGVPKVLLSMDGASSWGSGIAELIQGMQKFTFLPWTDRIESAISPLVSPSTKFVEFDYAKLLQPTQTQVIQNIVAEIDAGLLTVDEGRRLLNRPPLTNAQKAERQPSQQTQQED